MFTGPPRPFHGSLAVTLRKVPFLARLARGPEIQAHTITEPALQKVCYLIF